MIGAKTTCLVCTVGDVAPTIPGAELLTDTVVVAVAVAVAVAVVVAVAVASAAATPVAATNAAAAPTPTAVFSALVSCCLHFTVDQSQRKFVWQIHPFKAVWLADCSTIAEALTPSIPVQSS